MAGVEEVRAGIALSNEKARESIAALEQAKSALGEAGQALLAATGGSSQEEIQHAQGALAEAEDQIANVQGAINGSVSSTEAYAGRL